MEKFSGYARALYRSSGARQNLGLSIKFDGEAFAGAVSCDGAGLSSKEKEKNGKRGGRNSWSRGLALSSLKLLISLRMRFSRSA